MSTKKRILVTLIVAVLAAIVIFPGTLATEGPSSVSTQHANLSSHLFPQEPVE